MLREEYFDLLPDISRVAEQLRAEIQFHTLSISLRLGKHEQLVVKARIKECNSAIDKLRRKQESGDFDRSNPQQYSLTSLHDLAGVRVLAFPRRMLTEIDEALQSRFLSPNWTPRPVFNKETDEVLAFKYHGLCPEASVRVQGEYQIVSMLTGLFWDVEHAAIYKPAPGLKRIKGDKKMNDRTSAVYQALTAFEDEFERKISQLDASARSMEGVIEPSR